MSVDIYSSRRTKYHKCLYWERNESNLNDDDTLIYNKAPNGSFYAKDVSDITKNNNDVNNMWKIDVEEVVIETSDIVGNIKKDDLVEFDGLLYRVDYVKQKHIHKRHEFGKSDGLITTLNLRR